MPNFTRDTYAGLITQRTAAQEHLVADFGSDAYADGATFDVIVVGSGIGGGLVADDLADRGKRVLVLEAGSYLLPTHVYNVCRFPNDKVADAHAVTTFDQATNEGDDSFIGKLPQLNFGGRSVFWSGLTPWPQPWELDFFPPAVRQGLFDTLAGTRSTLNDSATMGEHAQMIVERLRASPLAAHFKIEETPRALHQPYLTDQRPADGSQWLIPTGVFNTAELLLNQLNFRPPSQGNGPTTVGLHLLLNHYVERVERLADGRWTVHATDVLKNRARQFIAPAVVVAAGSMESPKIIRRSPCFDSMPPERQHLVGRGLTDHPTTPHVRASVTHVHGQHIPRNAHAKIILYSLGKRESGQIVHPFNVEINVNHEYWHLRENDPTSAEQPIAADGHSTLELKYSFGAVLDDRNAMRLSPAGYVLGVDYRNNARFAYERLNELAGWTKSFQDVTHHLDGVTHQIFSQFTRDGLMPDVSGYFGRPNPQPHAGLFGYGTVHHAVGTLRMPARPRLDADFDSQSVVDEDLAVVGQPGLYVCDMSVMPLSCAANPVRALAALAARLAGRLAP